MAKKANNHGGRRVGAGRKSKSALEKLEKNNPGHRPIKIIQQPEDGSAELEGIEMPDVQEFLSAQQRDGRNLLAGEIYKRVMAWLKSLKVDMIVGSELVQQYAMSCARWKQMQEGITKYGFLGKHPTSGNPIQSPYVAMENTFLKEAQSSWQNIYQIVKENCAVDFTATDPSNDVMEMLLRKREMERKNRGK
ncbi:MAG: P27 family phage terminase small subunit [Bacilli bacterium]|nr:P27 family phage terminase small subunit [Bacilli bacterium]